MQDGIPRLPPSTCLTERKLLENADFIGVEYHSMLTCKSKRGVKREESKETYKLPHRLIEKKRRDRINECISQLKDLLPEHLKLTTLGHLEKAVVLELTLKHLKALTTLTEQQHHRIIALQNGDATLKVPKRSDLDAFYSGFQTCAQEVLQHLSGCEGRSSREQLLSHLHRAAMQPPPSGGERSVGDRARENCVPVIQRAAACQQRSSDTDTDSGYGGEGEQGLGPPVGTGHGSLAVQIKSEPVDPPAKRLKVTGPEFGCDLGLCPVGVGGIGQQPPFCLPLCFITPSAAVPYLTLLDKGSLEKCWCPAPFPLLCPGIPALVPETQLGRFLSLEPAATVGLCPAGSQAGLPIGMERDLSRSPELLQSPAGTS
ncbi:class E basic helix-loop-helix protein 41 [Hypanus sabinus]|uniref:class E basic helix-loop-helix protein 41 n=1 Tax=Hypanus sabinus TaxID=79690 RepID=UPI0028C3C6CE|nr:class E basic helix-loop-helix protein 41 [Hypanus sabinus]